MSGAETTEPCDDAEIMRLWRECGLPEYFLVNKGSNHKLVAFAARCRQGLVEPHPDQLADDLQMLSRIARRYEALARAECRRQGIEPDELISDSGHAAWELVGYEAAKKEMPDVE